MRDNLRTSISKSISKHCCFSEEDVLLSIIKFGSVDLVIDATDYANKNNLSLDNACSILYKSQAMRV